MYLMYTPDIIQCVCVCCARLLKCCGRHRIAQGLDANVETTQEDKASSGSDDRQRDKD